jgi:carbon monoxide dehydrogenase subunit G
MEPITSSIEIDRPADEVFAYATDPTRFPEWQTDVAGVVLEGKGVGARFTTTRQIGPARQSIVQEITLLDAPRRWVARGVSGAILAGGTVTVEPLDEGRRSLVTFGLEFEAHGVARAILPLVVRQTRAAAPRSYQRLKELLERG